MSRPFQPSQTQASEQITPPTVPRNCQIRLPVQVTRKPIAPLCDQGLLNHLWFLSGQHWAAGGCDSLFSSVSVTSHYSSGPASALETLMCYDLTPVTLHCASLEGAERAGARGDLLCAPPLSPPRIGLLIFLGLSLGAQSFMAWSISKWQLLVSKWSRRVALPPPSDKGRQSQEIDHVG